VGAPGDRELGLATRTSGACRKRVEVTAAAIRRAYPLLTDKRRPTACRAGHVRSEGRPLERRLVRTCHLLFRVAPPLPMPSIPFTSPTRRSPNHPNEDRRHHHIDRPQQNSERRPKPRDHQQTELDRDGSQRQPNEPTLPRMISKNVQRHALLSRRRFPRTL